MPERLILILAEKYGQSPGEVENWEPWWLNRCIIDLEAEGIKAKRENDALKRKARR